MDRHKIDRLKANALDALQRGQKPESIRNYLEVISTYELYPFMVDAQLGLYFNMLLAHLDQHDSPQMDGVIETLINIFDELETPTPLSVEVGTRLCLLLAHPLPQVHEDLQSALLHTASRHGNPTANYKDPRFVLEEAIRPNTLTQLSPMDSGLLCYILVNQTSTQEMLPSWMHRLYRRHLVTPPIPLEIQESLELFSSRCQQDDIPNAYLSLLTALEWAVDYAPFLAFEWSLGLTALEQIPEIERLTYRPKLPLEHRVELSIKLHRCLAIDLIDEGDAERLALHHWQEVINLSLYRIYMIDHRNQEGRSIQSGDLEARGWASVRIAEGFCAQGAFTQGLNILADTHIQAQRRSFSDTYLTTFIFRQYGGLQERCRDDLKAQDEYQSAIQVALPGLIHLNRFEDIMPLIELLKCGLYPGTFIIAVKCYIDLLRLGNFSPALPRIQLVRYLLSDARLYLTHQIYVDVQMYLELTASLFDDQVAPYRALEYARILYHRSGISLSLLNICKQEEKSSWEDRSSLGKLRNEYRRASHEARRAGGSNIQRQLNLNAALLMLHQKLQEYSPLTPSETFQLDEDLEMHFKQFLDEVSISILSDLSGELDLLLPPTKLTELENSVNLLLENQHTKSARQLCSVLRQLNRHFFYVTSKRDFSHNIHQMHYNRFTMRWINYQEVPLRMYRVYNTLISRNDTPKWPQRALNSREARLEFHVFDQWTVMFLISHQQTIHVHRINQSITSLRTQINELKSYLVPGGEDQYLLRECSTNLYSILLDPFESILKHIHRLTIIPDGPFTALPFSLLRSRQGRYLVEKLEVVMACPTAEPVFLSITPKDIPIFYAVGDEEDTNQICQSLTMLCDKDGFHHMYPLTPEEFSELELSSGQIGTHTVYLQGHTTPDSSISFSVNHSPMPIGQVIHSLVSLNTACAILAGPVNREMSQEMIRTLLTAVHAGLLVCHWDNPYNQTFLRDFLDRAVDTYQSIGFIEALNTARRTAISERRSPIDWAAFELYISERQ